MTSTFSSTRGNHYHEFYGNHFFTFLYSVPPNRHYSYTLPIIDLSINRVIQYVFFCIRLLSPNVMFVRTTHAVCECSMFFHCCIVFYYMPKITIYLSILLWIDIGILPVWGYDEKWFWRLLVHWLQWSFSIIHRCILSLYCPERVFSSQYTPLCPYHFICCLAGNQKLLKK